MIEIWASSDASRLHLRKRESGVEEKRVTYEAALAAAIVARRAAVQDRIG